MIEYILASFGIAIVIFFILFGFASDQSVNKGSFYPSNYELFVLNVKLLFAPILKGSRWKKLVKSNTSELNVDALTRVIAFNPNPDHIKDFKKVCKVKEEEGESKGKDGNTIPFLYPAAISVYPIACILASKDYPFPAIGSVHVYNTTTLLKPLNEKEKYTMILKPSKTLTHVKKGTEVEFLSTLLDAKNTTVWLNSTKFLIIHNQRKKVESLDGTLSVWSEPEEADLTLLFEDIWSLGPNSSVEYASVSKDFNPIHMNKLLAKLFGFPGIIMHGLYMISRAASECQRVMASDVSYPLEVSTKFTRPCVLPQKVSFKVFSMRGNKKSLYFTIKGKSEKILLDGYLKASKKV